MLSLRLVQSIVLSMGRLIYHHICFEPNHLSILSMISLGWTCSWDSCSKKTGLANLVLPAFVAVVVSSQFHDRPIYSLFSINFSPVDPSFSRAWPWGDSSQKPHVDQEPGEWGGAGNVQAPKWWPFGEHQVLATGFQVAKYWFQIYFSLAWFWFLCQVLDPASTSTSEGNHTD